MDIPGVPESMTRAQYTALIAAAGLSADNLVSLEFRPDGIHAEVFARDADGKDLVDTAKNEMMTHSIYIPVRD